MKDTVTMKELLAILVRRGKAILLVSVAFAVLLGTVQAVRRVGEAEKEENSSEKIEERYQQACEEYEESKNELETQLLRAQTGLENQREWQEEGILMHLDAYDVWTARVHFAVSEVDTSSVQSVFGTDGVAEGYILERITNQYVAYWEGIDLEEVLADTEHGVFEEKYIREVILLDQSEGGVLTITAYGENEEAVKEAVGAVYAFLRENSGRISDTVAYHELKELGTSVKNAASAEVEEAQGASEKKVSDYKTEIEALSTQLKELEEPKKEAGFSALGIVKSAVKYAVLGAVLGCVIICVAVVVLYLFRNRVETSFQLEQALACMCFGSVVTQKGFWENMADHILGERRWKEKETALAYIRENGHAQLRGKKKVLIASTVKNVDEETVAALKKALSSACEEVRFVNDAARNPAAVAALKDCDGLVFAERAGISNYNEIAQVLQAAKVQNKEICGFVMV